MIVFLINIKETMVIPKLKILYDNIQTTIIFGRITMCCIDEFSDDSFLIIDTTEDKKMIKMKNYLIF